jgi:hypothetical protein
MKPTKKQLKKALIAAEMLQEKIDLYHLSDKLLDRGAYTKEWHQEVHLMIERADTFDALGVLSIFIARALQDSDPIPTVIINWGLKGSINTDTVQMYQCNTKGTSTTFPCEISVLTETSIAISWDALP